MLLADGSIHSDSEGPPKGLFVSGYIHDEKFFPEGDIEGEGSLGGAGHPGWIELFNGTFHGDETSRPPFPPYVKGVMTSDGFSPYSRRVVY